MNKLLTALLILILSGLLLPALSLAAGGGGYPLSPANVDIDNKAAIQRGAKVFSDYCLSCHSARFVRFNRLAQDAGLSEEQVMKNLNHLGVKFGDTMTAAMTTAYAKASFGAEPPDLSLVARSKGADWLFTYLLGFYADPNRSTGHNNVVFKDVGMPNVFWRQQGVQEGIFEEHVNDKGEKEKVLIGLKLVEQGTMDPSDFREMIRDLVTFLEYIGEPHKEDRKRLGVWVLLFLFVFFIFSYLMKKEYWKDVH